MKSLIATLTEENQQLNAERTAIRERIDALAALVKAAKERQAELELQLKGARSRVQKLNAAVRQR
jgi:regulator of replication initiation timing